ncbi:MAG: GDP-mannose 4,6-dehydratase [Paracoccaceae bacterium]
MTQKPVAIVTGGAGFIGSHMVDLLVDQGYKVRVIDNLVGGREANLEHHSNENNVEAEWRDIRSLDPGDVLFSDVNYVFHFAGIGDIVPSIEQPVEYMSTNVQGTVKVLEAARAAGTIKKFVYAASSSCYGLAETPTREDHSIQPKYPYALSKYQGEQAVFHWHDVYKLPANSIRIFNAYGTRSRTSGAYGAVFGVFLRQKLAEKPFTIVGDGTQRRDFVYVTDLAEAFLLAGTSDISGQVFNVGAGNPQSINRLVELLGGEKTLIPKRPGEPDCTFADITKIKNVLGWTPRVTFEDGVKEVVDNIGYWADAPLWDPDSIEKASEIWFKMLGNKNS